MHRTWKPVEPRARTGRTANVALAITALASLVLAAARIIQSISLTVPLQFTTSGAEEEALASIWRFIHDQPVYTDPRAIPYTASFFNWLFYAGYGKVANGALRMGGLSEAWLPTVCRLITLAFAVAGAAIFAGIVRKATDGRMGRSVAFLCGTLAFFNPLCGFWVITTRPDIGAAVLELGAVAMFLRYRRTERLLDLAGVALFLEAAWAFKQTSIGALAGIALALLFLHGRLRRPEVDGYQRTLGLGAMFCAGVAIACAVLGPLYRSGLYLSQIHAGFHLSWALLHFGGALSKMPFIAAALGGAVLAWRRSDGTLRTVSLVLFATFFLQLVASSKGGSGDYYFLSLGVWSTLWIALALDRFPSRALRRALVAASLLQLGAIAVVFAGQRGTIDPRDPAQPYEHLTRYLATRAGPVFVQDTYGDLPWISPRAPHFVIASNYQVNALAGVNFQAGGWPGLLDRNYFATVVTDAGAHGLPASLLTRYRFVRAETGWRYYERR
jgi:hypothetical protein